MSIVIMGVQGSGKGTQAARLATLYKIPHISTGELLRQGGGKLQREIDAVLENGEMVTDELMVKLLKERIKKKDCKEGFILDGFPRNRKQARLLDNITKVEWVIEIKISDREAMKRLTGRMHCPLCDRNYNVVTAPRPKREGICDRDGVRLMRREDDTPAAMRRRIKDFHKKTEPLRRYYKKKGITVDGKKSIEEITAEIVKKVGKKKK